MWSYEGWTPERRRTTDPDIQLGWELIGRMVRRRRLALRWSQRDLAFAGRLDQSIISRLENGRLPGLRIARFARLVAALGGLEVDAPHPPSPYRSGPYRW